MIVVSNTSPLTSLAAALLEAKRLGEIEDIRSRLDALRHRAGFFIGAGLYEQVLEQAGERDI